MAEEKWNPGVDDYIRKNKEWREEFEKLRTFLLDCGLNEEIKWNHPCYTHEGRNIVVMQEFKDYCALMFLKGALLKDPNGILVAMTENTQAARQMRFTNVQQVLELQPLVKAYVQEAIEVEQAGLKVEFKDTAEFNFPDELVQKLQENPEFAEAWEALTPGRQRGYLLHFSGAKQSRTRVSRIEKSMEKIFAGKGFNER